MLSYEFYKVLHLTMIFSFLVCVAIQFTASESTKLVKILTGVTSFFILVAGMGLLARIGISHGQAFPGWATTKIVLWLVMAAGAPILGKRLKAHRQKALVGFVVLSALAAYFAINKPF